MKKCFEEPELTRIELNLMERIATSGEGSGYIGQYETRQAAGTTCTTYVVNTQFSYTEMLADKEKYVLAFDCLVGSPEAAAIDLGIDL